MKVKELLSDKNKWTEAAYARFANKYIATSGTGNKCYLDPHAASYCLVGAIAHCYNNDVVDVLGPVMRPMLERIERALLDSPRYDDISDAVLFNDEMGYDAVIELCNKLDI